MNHSDRIEKKTLTSWGSPYNLTCTVLAVILGLGVGWLDLHVTEVVITILALLVAGLVLGLLQPVAAWRWPVLIVMGLPIMVIVVRTTRMQTAEPARFDIRIILIALVFALAGAYSGALVRHFIRTLTDR